jgi:hypothetical protein
MNAQIYDTQLKEETKLNFDVISVITNYEEPVKLRNVILFYFFSQDFVKLQDLYLH